MRVRFEVVHVRFDGVHVGVDVVHVGFEEVQLTHLVPTDSPWDAVGYTARGRSMLLLEQ